MTNFNPLNFIASHAGMNLADAIKEAYEQGEMDAQSERKTGYWIEHEWAEEVGGILVSNYECSECHCWKREASDYCPNCGADMLV